MSSREPTPGAAYTSRPYAESLVHVGTPLELPRAGTHLMKRPLPAALRAVASGGDALADGWDACAPYPLLSVPEPSGLAPDLEALGSGPVSITAVIDPLSGLSEDDIAAAFPELHRPFKRHHVAELDRDPEEFASKHHRKELRRARRSVSVEPAALEGTVLGRWIELYAALTARHGITGPAAFPRESFEAFATTPGLLAFTAKVEDSIAGMVLWLVDGDRAWYHLAATDEVGYRTGASYALMGSALAYLRELGVATALLGGGAGGGGDLDEEDGLARFKRGWASTSVDAWIGGRICDPGRYDELVARRAPEPGSRWFPLYRHPLPTPDRIG